MENVIRNNILQFLKMVVEGTKFWDYEYSAQEIQIVNMAIEKNYVKGIQIESDYIYPGGKVYYIGAKPNETITLTSEGIDYFSTLEKEKIMNYNDQKFMIKEILTSLYKKGELAHSHFENISWNDYISMVYRCQKDGFISDVKFSKGGNNNSPLAANTDGVTLTDKGIRLVEGESRETKMTNMQNINIDKSLKSLHFKNKDFYNLIVTSEETAWESNKYEIEMSRFLEHTNNDIRKRYKILNDIELEEIKNFPCLFLYELNRGDYGYIGYITNIKVRSNSIGIKFEKVDKISIDDILKLEFELDIENNSRSLTELHRTHWAIKKVNLIEELQEYNNDLVPAISKPKVFISYSWASKKTKKDVESLVKQLQKDNVEVVYDKNSLQYGQDMTYFMERLGNDASIKKVLVICDESYTQKSNSREGGVGTESEIIIPGVYNKPLQVKTIPVFFDKDENNKPFLPTFLKSRYGVDLGSDHDGVNYENLLRNIFS